MSEVEISWLLGQLRVLARMVSIRGIQDVDIPQLHEARIFLSWLAHLYLVLTIATLVDPFPFKA